MEISKIDKDKYQVFIMGCPAFFPFSFAVHPWIVLNKKGVISRWEVRHYKNKKDRSHLFINEQPPFLGLSAFSFLKIPNDKVYLIGQVEGGEDSVAYKIIEFTEKSRKNYRFVNRYSLKGPNSNTYVQWILNKFPEVKIKLPFNCFGKNYKF